MALVELMIVTGSKVTDEDRIWCVTRATEEQMVLFLTEHMPQEMRENFEHITQQLHHHPLHCCTALLACLSSSSEAPLEINNLDSAPSLSASKNHCSNFVSFALLLLSFS